MRILLQILKRYWTSILFVLLLLIGLNLTSKRNSMMGLDVLSSSNSVSGFLYNIHYGTVQYFNLKPLSDSLINENTRLRNELAASIGTDTLQDIIVSLPVYANDSNYKKNQAANIDSLTGQPIVDSNARKFGEKKIVKYADYHYIPARVVNNTIAHESMNYLTINRGSSDGIKANMSVVTHNGIVGRVINVSEHFATVLTVLSKGRTYNARLMDGTEEQIRWDVGSSNAVTMTRVPKLVDVRVGDTVLTAHHSIFPAGVLVGTVAEIEEDEKTSSLNIRILLSTNFRKLQYVYVVNNDYISEQAQLEKETKKSLSQAEQ